MSSARRSLLALSPCVTLVLTLAVASPAAAQKAVKFYPASITFTDSPASSSLVDEVRLTDDGYGKTYEGATIVTADSANLNIDLSRSPRRFSVTLKDGTAYTGPLPAGTGPGQAGVTYITGTQLNVYGVRSLLVGASAVRDMGITVDEIKRGYRLRFWPNAGIGTRVCVTRTSQQTWTVSSLKALDACGTSGDTSGGETTRLIDSSRSTNPLIGTYVMPFSFTVDCPTCQ
ncbi:hypothetical protein [Luteitalea sp. TBR-22]|uniref:hypothetical protein n=1 Tax=Luteitalea sp. TBR-22 TaxID=2802971 RepID=UPI001EF4D3F6|nr:hypothetical protein [Luteitalea sp. TBR-22]